MWSTHQIEDRELRVASCHACHYYLLASRETTMANKVVFSSTRGVLLLSALLLFYEPTSFAFAPSYGRQAGPCIPCCRIANQGQAQADDNIIIGTSSSQQPAVLPADAFSTYSALYWSRLRPDPDRHSVLS